jgi:transposase
MARPASGRDVLEQAKQAIASARTVEQLRQAQAVVLPLEFGLTLPQTAQAIGVSVGWAKLAKGELTPKQRRGGRRRENLTRQQEAQFLAPFFEQASAGGVLIVSSIKQALEGRLGRGVALSSVYNLLHRHGWRKLAPDTRHPQADFAAQEQWKKNSPKRWRRASRKSKGKARSG